MVDYVAETKGNVCLPGVMALGYIAAHSETLAMAVIVSKVCCIYVLYIRTYVHSLVTVCMYIYAHLCVCLLCACVHEAVHLQHSKGVACYTM